MSATSVTLASVLHIRDEALSEEEIWSLLSLAAERLLEDLYHDSSHYVVCPWSVLLSASGSLSFQDHVSRIEAAPFKAPELLQGQNGDEQPDKSQMHVYSLGMTLYWSAGFRVPSNQRLQLCEPLHSLLLAMCEDQPCRRRPLKAVLDACRVHQEEVTVSPEPASFHISRLVGLVLGTISEVERRVVEESACDRQSRSYLLRKRLQGACSESPAAQVAHGLQPRRVSERSTETQSSPEPRWTPAHSGRSLCVNSSLAGAGACGFQEQCGSEPVLLAEADGSQPASSSPGNFLRGKKKFSRPEFIQLAREAPVTLHLPGSIVTRKGKSYLALRDLCVVLLSGQCLEVKCDMESTVGAVFDVVMSFTNLEETTYFGLANVKGNEFFFLDHETRLCKVAPECWRDQPLKASTKTFTLFLRIKFFVGHYGLLRHSLTRHQFYLQLRKDILEERLYCNDETLLQLGVLALQAEFGSYPKEVERKAYFRVEDYIPARVMERMTAAQVQAEVSEKHRLSSAPWGEEAELEFLELAQQLPEYGVLVHRVFPEKKRPEGEIALGICAKGVVVYEMKNNSRIATSRFPWRETGKISTRRKKFTITSSITGKKHVFVTDSAKTCKYLLGLCSAQHRFNAQMGSGRPARPLLDQDKFAQISNSTSAHQTQANPLTWIQRLSCSEKALYVPDLQSTVGGPLSTFMENFHVDGSKETPKEPFGGSPYTGRERMDHTALIPKPAAHVLSGAPVESVRTASQNRRKNITAEPGREIMCVTLMRDPHCGFGKRPPEGFAMNEGEDGGQDNPGIYISSLIPGGPAEKAKKIKPGGKILALNHITLEGFTFDMAVRMIQNSPDNIELIVSQSKDASRSGGKDGAMSSGMFSSGILSHGYRGSLSSHTQDQDGDAGGQEMTQSAGSSCPPSPPETTVGEIYFVELIKEDGTLGFSVTGGINTSVPYGGIYVKSIIPGGPAAKEGQMRQGDRLLQVDGVSLCGLTHKQAVQCLKGPGQVARLVLKRRSPRTAQQCPSANDGTREEHMAVSLVTARPGRPGSCVSVTDGPKFEVKLKKNNNGLGFSFVQMEREGSSHLQRGRVRIKRLFPGQPAEEHGDIAAGDVILAVNGRSTEGLAFQEVLHLLRGAPQEVTLLLCRPPPGVLPEMEQSWQIPELSADQRLSRAACSDSERSPSLDQDGWRDSASLDVGEGLIPRPESFHEAVREVQGDQDTGRSWARSLVHPLESHPHICKLHQKSESPTSVTSLEKDMRQNCYSACDVSRLGSPGLDADDAEGFTCCKPETSSLTWEDEDYLTFNSATQGQLPCRECLEVDSETIPLPRFCSWGALPESLLPERSYGSDSDWEDLEEPVDVGDSALR